MKKYLDIDFNEIRTEADLQAELDEKKRLNDFYKDKTLDAYIKEKTKAGELAAIRMTLCKHCLEAIRSRGEKLRAVHVCPDFPDEDAADDPDAASFCDWCEEAGHTDIYAVI